MEGKMSSKVLPVLGLLLAAAVLFASDVAAANSVETAKASGHVFINQARPRPPPPPPAACVTCGNFSSGQCRCCVRTGKATHKAVAAVNLIEMTAALTDAGDQAINPQATCYYCGFILPGRCNCCFSNANAGEKVAKVEPKN